MAKKESSFSIGKLVFLLVGGFFAVKALADQAGSAIADRIKIGNPSASNFQVGFNGVTFILKIPLTNDLSFPLPSNSFSGNLLFNGNPVGSVNYPTIDIGPGQTSEITSTVNLSLSAFPNVLSTVIQNPSSLLDGLLLKGQFMSNGVPFNYQSTVTL